MTGLVLAQLPIQDKDCEISAIPRLLELLDIRESTVTIDAIGTQTEIMGQIISQGGHFVLTVKKDQPQSYDEIMKYFGEMSADYKKLKKEPDFRPFVKRVGSNQKGTLVNRKPSAPCIG